MRVGYCEEDITPNGSVLLGGYDINNRLSTGVHDSIYCKTIVIDVESKKYAFIQFDLLCVSNKFVSKLKNKLCNLGIDKDNIFIGAIHTHSAPLGISEIGCFENVFGCYDDVYSDYCIDNALNAYKKSINNLVESKINVSHMCINDICSERHDKDKDSDNILWKIVFQRIDGIELLIYNYSCHPTIMHEDNTLISADFPGVVARELKNKYDMVMFCNGSAGDISTRFTRQKSGFEEVERIGKSIANQILHNDESKINIDEPELALNTLKISLKTFDKYHVQKFKDFCINNGSLSSKSNYEYSNTLLKSISGHIELEVIVLKISKNINIVMIPSEIYSSVTKPLRENNCMIFSYTNGYNLYIPDDEAYDRCYYEAAMTYLKKGEYHILIDKILNML